MNLLKSENTLGKKMVAILAATAIGLGLTLTGCAPDDFEAPEDPGEPALPGEPAPDQPGQPEEPPALPGQDDEGDEESNAPAY